MTDTRREEFVRLLDATIDEERLRAEGLGGSPSRVRIKRARVIAAYDKEVQGAAAELAACVQHVKELRERDAATAVQGGEPVAWLDEHGRVVVREDALGGGWITMNRAAPDNWTPLAAAPPVQVKGEAVVLEPTPSMIDAGAQRLVSWEDGCVWPDSWDALQVAAARNEAERVWRSMWLAAQPAARQDEGREE